MKGLVPVVATTLEADTDGQFTPEELDDRRAADMAPAIGGVSKHYGPGPHPGTRTPQSIHSEGGSTNRTTIAPTRTRTTTTSFTGEWEPNERDIVQRSVDLFNEKFPGLLPADVEFRMEIFPEAEANTFAYSVNNPFTGVEPVIHVNAQQFDAGGMGEDGEFYSFEEVLKTHAPHKTHVSIEVAGGSVDKFMEATFLHELGHLVDIPQHLQPDIPIYNFEWFPNGPTTPLKDNNLPSEYAAASPLEFVAEAFTDVAYNGEEAGEYSHRIVTVLGDYHRGDS